MVLVLAVRPDVAFEGALRVEALEDASLAAVARVVRPIELFDGPCPRASKLLSLFDLCCNSCRLASALKNKKEIIGLRKSDVLS